MKFTTSSIVHFVMWKLGDMYPSYQKSEWKICAQKYTFFFFLPAYRWVYGKLLTKGKRKKLCVLIHCSPEVNCQFTGKDSDAEKDWRQKKREIEDEIVEWHHRCNGHELGQTLRDGVGQGSLVPSSPWGCKESDTTWWLNNNNNNN